MRKPHPTASSKTLFAAASPFFPGSTASPLDIEADNTVVAKPRSATSPKTRVIKDPHKRRRKGTPSLPYDNKKPSPLCHNIRAISTDREGRKNLQTENKAYHLSLELHRRRQRPPRTTGKPLRPTIAPIVEKKISSTRGLNSRLARKVIEPKSIYNNEVETPTPNPSNSTRNPDPRMWR